jgi:hypothetical protein
MPWLFDFVYAIGWTALEYLKHDSSTLEKDFELVVRKIRWTFRVYDNSS